MPAPTVENNKALAMLAAAEEGKYGIPGIVSYNLETIVAVVRAAEAAESPMQILLFPWAIHYAGGLLVNLAADACRSAKVPISLHLDHAQSEDIIKFAADMPGCPFDSIMVDMSHYEKEENLEKTRVLTEYCHARGIATEAEPGRMEGGEDGVQDTGDLEGVLTTPEEAMEFVNTGIDILAPAFGNVHGNYGGVENMKMDFPRLESIRVATKGKVQMVLHGTNGFPHSIMKDCVKHGMTRCNVNEWVLHKASSFWSQKTGKLPLTGLMEEGSKLIQEMIDELIDVLGSRGKAQKA